MTLLLRQTTAKLGILIVYGCTLHGCAFLQPGYTSDSYTELLAVPLWFSPNDSYEPPNTPMPIDYAGAAEISTQPFTSSKPGAHVTPNNIPDLQLLQPQFAFEEARLGVQSRLDKMESAPQAAVPGTSLQPDRHDGALPSDVTRSSQYRNDLLAKEKLKGLSTDYGAGGKQGPANLWINQAPGAYSPVFRFRAPMPK